MKKELKIVRLPITPGRERVQLKVTIQASVHDLLQDASDESGASKTYLVEQALVQYLSE